MGRILAPFGVKGWFKVKPFAQLESLLNYTNWWIGKADNWREAKVVEAAVHGNVLTAQLADCTNREQALALKGFEIGIPRAQIPPAGPNEYYWFDLIGSQVFNRDGEALGEVTGLIETGANEVLCVQAERERLIPFLTQTIIEIDISEKRIIVDWDKDY